MSSCLFLLLCLIFCAIFGYTGGKCTKNVKVLPGHSCWVLWSNNHLAEEEFRQINPGINCERLQPGQTVCVAVEPDGKCNKTVKVSQGNSCWSLRSSNHLSEEEFLQINPAVNCDDLKIGQTVCVAVGSGENSTEDNLVTFEQFRQAVVDCKFPPPSYDQYANCVSQADKGLIRTKRELAMFVAQIIHESAGLTQKIEAQCQMGCPGHYQTHSDVPGKDYYGRGYMHLTWHYNYLAASRNLYGDDRLAKTPHLVATDDSVAWATAFWFWKANVHSAYGVSLGQFGATTKAINGALECKKNGNIQAAKTRFSHYKKVLNRFDPTEKPLEMGCYN